LHLTPLGIQRRPCVGELAFDPPPFGVDPRLRLLTFSLEGCFPLPLRNSGGISGRLHRFGARARRLGGEPLLSVRSRGRQFRLETTAPLGTGGLELRLPLSFGFRASGRQVGVEPECPFSFSGLEARRPALFRFGFRGLPGARDRLGMPFGNGPQLRLQFRLEARADAVHDVLNLLLGHVLALSGASSGKSSSENRANPSTTAT
jgi:hypothetical protein